MIRISLVKLAPLGLCIAVTAGCASSPVAPFNQMEKSNLTAFHLQNYEPPAAAQGAAAPQGQQLLSAMPPEIQQWIAAGAQGLQQLLPPGLVPQNLLQPQQQAAQPVENVPRFYGFRILGQTQVMDSELRAKLGEIFGDPDNFETPRTPCLYPELGFAFGSAPGAPTYDFLVSFSCKQVQAKNFQWPHPQTGMTSETVKQLSEVVSKLLPG